MRTLTLFVPLLFLHTLLVSAQVERFAPTNTVPALAQSEIDHYMHRATLSASSFPDNNIDVSYYKLDLAITTSPNHVRGLVTVKARSTVNNLATITLDFRNTLTVDSIRSGGALLAFQHDSTTLRISLDRSYQTGDLISLDIYYGGVPIPAQFGSFMFGEHGGTPWVWTLSEPYGARDWWPCKDHPSDKADSMDIWVTCRSDFKVGANGKLTRIVDNGNGTRTWQWSERYPITTYLVMVALTNYAEFSHWFRYSPADSMQVINFVLPENLATAQAVLPLSVAMLSVFSDRFGLYPFINEKFGHAEFGWGGGMEHQTMTSIQNYNETNVAHELSHQWFGDLISPASWRDLWLNEGFAVYAEAVYYEAKNGTAAYWADMLPKLTRAKTAVGPVYAQDTTNVRVLFDHARVYIKGSVVLHMLRRVLGDSTFFHCLQAYVAAPQLRFGVATTEDFKRVCEAVSGRDLGFFFREWIYGESYPTYAYSWQVRPTGATWEVSLRVTQTTGTTNPSFFTMPIDVRLSAPGWDTTIVVLNDAQVQEFRMTVLHLPTRCQLDPDTWLLRDVTALSEVTHNGPAPPDGFMLEQNYPNPFNPITEIRFHIAAFGLVTLSVYDLLGREVATLVNAKLNPGSHAARWNATGFPSGVYIYRLSAVPTARPASPSTQRNERDLVPTDRRDGQSGGHTISRRMTLIR